MAKIVFKGSAFIELVPDNIEGLWASSIAVLSTANTGVVDTGDADLYFQGSGFTGYDAHGFATAGTISKFGVVFPADDVRVDWTGLSLSAATLEHALKTANIDEFTAALWGENDRMVLNAGGAEVNGFAGNDTITGKGGADTIFGDIGNDALKGGANDDVLAGGLGRDMLTGGDDSDTFIYFATAESTTGGIDTIKDLDDVLDIIDVSAIDADTVAAGQQTFFLAPSFTGVAGQLVLTYDAGHDRTVIRGYTDTDSTADLVIYASGDHHDFANFQFGT